MLAISKLALRGFKPMVTSVRGKYPSTFYGMLNQLPDVHCSQLENGLRVVSEERLDLSHACVGIYVAAGSRYESKFENGICHFFEHLVFKGTNCRNEACVEQIMAETGARFKSFTERELCGYYAQCRSEDVGVIVGLLADCLFHNSFLPEAVSLQQQIVYKEMTEADKDINAVLMDYLHAAAFMNTPLAQSVIGPSHNLRNFSNKTLNQYLCKFFDPTRTILLGMGKIDHDQLVCLANLHLLKLKPAPCLDNPYRFTAGDIRFRDDAYPFCNTAIAWEAPPLGDPREFTLKVAAAYLGGWDTTQPGGPMCTGKLARAAHTGLADSYKSFYVQYKDTGLFGVQFMPPRNEMESFFHQVSDECMRMCTMATENEIKRSKHEVKTHIMTMYENLPYACAELARYTLYTCCGRPALVDQLKMVDKVTVEDFHELCTYFVYDKCFAIAAMGPCEQLLSYPRIRASFYWLRV